MKHLAIFFVLGTIGVLIVGDGQYYSGGEIFKGFLYGAIPSFLISALIGFKDKEPASASTVAVREMKKSETLVTLPVKGNPIDTLATYKRLIHEGKTHLEADAIVSNIVLDMHKKKEGEQKVQDMLRKNNNEYCNSMRFSHLAGNIHNQHHNK